MAITQTVTLELFNQKLFDKKLINLNRNVNKYIILNCKCLQILNMISPNAKLKIINVSLNLPQLGQNTHLESYTIF